ncbi:MAG TPA: molybdopterin cofactor-binding domain-containing protein [Micromonosporaceae bacterium]
MTGIIGASPNRSDSLAKVVGAFEYASDLVRDGMVWAVTLRSPHAHARIVAIDTSPAWAVAGVRDVITHAEVPGRKLYGQMNVDQPVLATDVVRYHGEPIAVVAADDPETARLAAERIRVDYEVLAAVTDPVTAIAPDSPAVHPSGNVVSHKLIRRGAAQSETFPPAATVVIRGEYTLGMQDHAFLGTESGLAVPDRDGGVRLYVATQWPHVDQEQIAASLGLAPERVVVSMAGVGGAFGGREDLSIHIHACLIALRLQRPVKMVYSRTESFFGHVHRHPAVLRYEHGAESDGRLIYVKAEIFMDGGAYAASSPAIAGNAATHAAGPYAVPHVRSEAWAVYTNNPPCGAMRGFGTVQPCFAYESQMDRLAEAVGIDPVEVRLRNALSEGGTLPTGQVLDSAAPVAELLVLLRDLPLPKASVSDRSVRRGVGYASCLKNSMFSEGFDDHSTAAVRLHVQDGRPIATVTSAAAELGQGVLDVKRQIVETELGVRDVEIIEADSSFPSAGPSSASRQTYMTGGAVRAACIEVRDEVLARARRHLGDSYNGPLTLTSGVIADSSGNPLLTLATALGAEAVVERTSEFHHRRTTPLDPDNGQGDSSVTFGFAAHRAVVDVDIELGLVQVVELAIAQDVGTAINPRAIRGQLQGGTLQGMGLAVMEELVVSDGRVLNPSFSDYLIPTMADAPPIIVEIMEFADPHAPYGVRGIGELPAISSTAAVAAAVNAATGRRVTRVPIRPDDLLDLDQ